MPTRYRRQALIDPALNPGMSRSVSIFHPVSGERDTYLACTVEAGELGLRYDKQVDRW